ncbi:MAG: D-alanyl-D-alanine carboxypeptidase [Cyanobacteria bacterium M5B4]|nr:MAG: D-alanyl-D-alanine carboxypeptidase [Cyanobacteria bacterium M5B4]
MWNLVALWLVANSLDRALLVNSPLMALSVLLIQNSVPVLAQSGFDPIAAQVTEKHLQTLQSRGYPRSLQGVWIQNQGGQLLASHQGDRPLPVASLTKIATTLAALSTWHRDSRFVTTIATNGSLSGSTLVGDLIVAGGADPLFVWEDGIKIGNYLETLGIKRIQGDLVVTSQFYMNFATDRVQSAGFFRRAINRDLWDGEVLTQYETLSRGTGRPQITITGTVRILPQATGRVLVQYRSLPLWQILKQMNIYSNNIIADVLMTNLGGTGKVIPKLVELSGIPSQEIRLSNGSGLGQSNQISPRGVVALLIALQKQASAQGLSLADLFPMGECRCGTIQDRYFSGGDILKTGTLSDVSTLAGVIQTRDRGLVWFALLNRGMGDISIFHQAQEEVLNSLHRNWREFVVWRPQSWQDSDRLIPQ